MEPRSTIGMVPHVTSGEHSVAAYHEEVGAGERRDSWVRHSMNTGSGLSITSDAIQGSQECGTHTASHQHGGMSDGLLSVFGLLVWRPLASQHFTTPLAWDVAALMQAKLLSLEERHGPFGPNRCLAGIAGAKGPPIRSFHLCLPQRTPNSHRCFASDGGRLLRKGNASRAQRTWMVPVGYSQWFGQGSELPCSRHL